MKWRIWVVCSGVRVGVLVRSLAGSDASSLMVLSRHPWSCERVCRGLAWCVILAISGVSSMGCGWCDGTLCFRRGVFLLGISLVGVRCVGRVVSSGCHVEFAEFRVGGVCSLC